MAHPIAAGDLFSTKDVEHVARPGCISRIIGGSYPLRAHKGRSSPPVWRMVTENRIKAYNVPPGIVFALLRKGAGKRPGVLNKVEMETGCSSDFFDVCSRCTIFTPVWVVLMAISGRFRQFQPAR